jgi:hypothetical protein
VLVVPRSDLSLTALDLSNNALGPLGVSLLSEVAAASPALVSVDLTGNLLGLGDGFNRAHARRVADSLVEHTQQARAARALAFAAGLHPRLGAGSAIRVLAAGARDDRRTGGCALALSDADALALVAELRTLIV